MIRYDVGEDAVARLVLDRPDAKNALTPEMRDDIVARVREARADPAVRALLITGVGDAFCAGMDLRQSTVAGSGAGRLRPSHDERDPARRRAGVHPRALGARQADRGRGQRNRGRPRRAIWRWPATSSWCATGHGSSGRSPSGDWSSTRAAPICCRASSGCRAPRPWSCSAKARAASRRSTLGLAYRCLPTAEELEHEADELRGSAGRRADPFDGALQATAQRDLRDRSLGVARSRSAGPGDGSGLAGDGRRHGRFRREASAGLPQRPLTLRAADPGAAR